MKEIIYDDLNYWPDLLNQKECLTKDKRESFLCFSIDDYSFALPAFVVRKVMLPRTIYPIPHTKIPFLLGIMKAKRELQLLICLKRFLFQQPSKLDAFERYILVHLEQDQFIFPANKVLGLCKPTESQYLPSLSVAGLPLYPFEFKNKIINRLDPKILFQKIKTKLKSSTYSGNR